MNSLTEITGLLCKKYNNWGLKIILTRLVLPIKDILSLFQSLTLSEVEGLLEAPYWGSEAAAPSLFFLLNIGSAHKGTKADGSQRSRELHIDSCHRSSHRISHRITCWSSEKHFCSHALLGHTSINIFLITKYSTYIAITAVMQCRFCHISIILACLFSLGLG